MDQNNVYDALEDLRCDLLAMAFEIKAMACEAYEDCMPDPTPLEAGKIAAFDALSCRLIAHSDTLCNALEVLGNEGHTPAPLLMFEGGSNG